MTQPELSDGELRPFEPLSRVLVIYKHEWPYLYGAISRMGCDTQNLEWHAPFMISKVDSIGEEDVYGTVVRTLKRVAAQVEKMKSYSVLSSKQLERASRKVNEQTLKLPKSELSTAILVVCRGFGWVVEGGAASADFGDDFFGGSVPDEGFGVLVPVGGPGFDGVDEFVHAGEAVAA